MSTMFAATDSLILISYQNHPFQVLSETSFGPISTADRTWLSHFHIYMAVAQLPLPISIKLYFLLCSRLSCSAQSRMGRPSRPVQVSHPVVTALPPPAASQPNPASEDCGGKLSSQWSLKNQSARKRPTKVLLQPAGRNPPTREKRWGGRPRLLKL